VEKNTRLFCNTCSYVCNIKNKLSSKIKITNKQVDSVIDTHSFDNAQIVEEPCKNKECDNKRASFIAFQTRSADEPQTEFYQCTKCLTTWRQN
jgi:DNA-directed RNA polymerase subunit M/transcription elongation factor TFIIS